MDNFKESISLWVTILGTLTGFFGAAQSRSWLTVTGAVATTLSVIAFLYARSQRAKLRAATVVVGGRALDSLNVASLRRRVNQTLVVQEANSHAVVDNEDLLLTWRCSGYCRAARESAIEFSIDADANTLFNDLDCVAFDLRRDPGRRNPIYPILVGPDGISKKIAVPFLEPVLQNEPFNVVLECRLPGCMNAGIDYYTASLSFEQDRIERYSTALTFKNAAPRWVRAYESRTGGDLKLLKDLRATRERNGVWTYIDHDRRVSARSARVYVFSRPDAICSTALQERHSASRQ